MPGITFLVCSSFCSTYLKVCILHILLSNSTERFPSQLVVPFPIFPECPGIQRRTDFVLYRLSLLRLTSFSDSCLENCLAMREDSNLLFYLHSRVKPSFHTLINNDSIWNLLHRKTRHPVATAVEGRGRETVTSVQFHSVTVRL